MVVKLVVIIAFLPTLLIAQQESMKKQIDSLVAKKVALTNELVEIDVKIKSLEIQMQDIIGSDSRANFSILEATTLYKKPNVFDGKILELQKEDSVKFISVPENKYFVEVSVSENRGYVLRRNVRDIDYYIERIEIEKRQEEEEKRQEEEEKLKAIADSIYAVFHMPFLEKGAMISLASAKVVSINSADGVDMAITWGLLDDTKTIKYLDFDVSAYNAVGDKISCRVQDQSSFTLSITGPIEYDGKYTTSYWDAVLYNSTARCVRVTRATVEFIDGSRVRYVRELPKTFSNGFTNDCSY